MKKLKSQMISHAHRWTCHVHLRMYSSLHESALTICMFADDPNLSAILVTIFVILEFFDRYFK